MMAYPRTQDAPIQQHNMHIAGLLLKPSDGLEPSTPSLP